MPNTEEQRLDIIENCDILLGTVLKPFENVDSTAEGRMVAQLHWLKERAENHDLPLPVEKGWLGTLLRVDVEGWINWTASSRDRVHDEIEVPMSRLVYLTREGRLLLKPAYYPYAIRCADTLIRLLNEAPRPLDQHERAAIDEARKLRDGLRDSKIEPPMRDYFSECPGLRKMFRFSKSSIDDLLNGFWLIKTFTNLYRNGIRPDTWLTPEDAEREVAAVERTLNAA
ncbi:hypothetical protein HC341_04435 [Aquisalimonas sp. 2447]|uniref:hypothetical protein n=1 Tax=Aquisalimonas sp. 2447 TaxID=2740807 RepID=UPI0014327FD6|nr:hypothetical protein [Aquisalimonas sp. 2447]QIT54529.1 hypothetical protein HC341_04435 [Aquisalimonas sp. 2447]